MHEKPIVHVPESVLTLFSSLEPAIDAFAKERDFKVRSYDHLKSGAASWMWNIVGEFFGRQVTVQVLVTEASAARSKASIDGFVWFYEPTKAWIRLTSAPMESPEDLARLLTWTASVLTSFLWLYERPPRGIAATA